MKILHIITLAEPGGAQSVVAELANQAIADGHAVAVLSREENGLWQLLNAKVKGYHSRIFRRNSSIIYDILAFAVVFFTFISFAPDVVHLHSSKAGIWGRIGLFFFRKKIIYTVHGFDSIRLKYRRFLFLERVLGKTTCKVIAVSEYDRRNLLKEGISPHAVIQNGVSDVTANPYNFNSFPQLVLGNEKWRVITIARLAPPKRFDLFLATASKLRSLPYHFFWIGNKEPIQNLPDNVTCLGEIPNARCLLKYFHVMLLPSDYEGLPMSILEALSAGLPVVASNVGGVSESLQSNYGAAVENSAVAMADAIQQFCKTQDSYLRASQEARAAFLKSFSADRMYKKYMSIYVECSRSPLI